VNVFGEVNYICMRVHLIKKQTIEKYAEANAQSRIPLKHWLNAIKIVDWTAASDIQATFGTADLLGNGTTRVVFNIGGNNYRLICKYIFGKTKVHLFICWVGTHTEYDKLCKDEKQYAINIY
jgi:mRNA interferase HigB